MKSVSPARAALLAATTGPIVSASVQVKTQYSLEPWMELVELLSQATDSPSNIIRTVFLYLFNVHNVIYRLFF